MVESNSKIIFLNLSRIIFKRSKNSRDFLSFSLLWRLEIYPKQTTPCGEHFFCKHEWFSVFFSFSFFFFMRSFRRSLRPAGFRRRWRETVGVFLIDIFGY